MKWLLLAFVSFTVVGSGARAEAGWSSSSSSVEAVDPVKVWNDLALASLREKRASDAEAARLLAMVNVAMYDAVNGIESRLGRDDRDHALVPPHGASPRADARAAAEAAAATVLKAAYPDLSSRYQAQLEDDDLGRQCHDRGHDRDHDRGHDRDRDRGSYGSITEGRSWGTLVGGQVVAMRTNDGSTPAETMVLGGIMGQFIGVWGGVQYRNLKPFAVANPADYVTAGPPAVGTLDYAAALAEVKLLGNATILDGEKSAIFQYWSLSTGTVQPPGEWVKIALEIAAARKLELAEKTRLLALTAMALADTVAPTVTTKLTYAHWRPTTAIRQAYADDNAYTDLDQSWVPRAGGAGTSPEHTSGHSAFSAAAATVLAGFFCQNAIPFSHVSDSAPGGQPRQFDSFSAAAAEAGRSRVFGGVHFEFSNQAGLTAGRGVAAEVLGKKLLRKRGRTHFGQCPL